MVQWGREDIPGPQGREERTISRTQDLSQPRGHGHHVSHFKTQTTSLRTIRTSHGCCQITPQSLEPQQRGLRVGKGLTVTWRLALELPSSSHLLGSPIPMEVTMPGTCRERPLSVGRLACSGMAPGAQAYPWHMFPHQIKPTSACLRSSSLVPYGQKPPRGPSPKCLISFPKRYDKFQNSRGANKTDLFLIGGGRAGGPGRVHGVRMQAPQILFHWVSLSFT